MAGGNYEYPLDQTWTMDEMMAVTTMYRVVEDAYEVGISPAKVLSAYQAFKQVANSKAYEKQLGREFYQASGYQLYDVVKAAQTTTAKQIKLEVH
ncbi:UPF0223 family protein [Limosilactobacillus equigenerosi]|uniref:Uncharacterized protein n=1 Tax=Limosilactobacillus equigenerosi DSM 18793 = JCM 14505 TaxID=1423742 RepID=A0A0R1USE7_9LACO|nr:UPF0223 family protein [Limosilactobacillus equigenerosi]KRL95982.1 hypothetical protein FC21_GL000679 [Limosilactobacillus equigenerosi DSM 18793 = JCM 14505]